MPRSIDTSLNSRQLHGRFCRLQSPWSGGTISLWDDTFGFPGAGVDHDGDIEKLLSRDVQPLHDLEYGLAIGLIKNDACLVIIAWNTFAQQRTELDADRHQRITFDELVKSRFSDDVVKNSRFIGFPPQAEHNLPIEAD
jgi:hypothetical protein